MFASFQNNDQSRGTVRHRCQLWDRGSELECLSQWLLAVSPPRRWALGLGLIPGSVPTRAPILQVPVPSWGATKDRRAVSL